MKPNAAQAALARRGGLSAILAGLLLAMLAMPALAGDRAGIGLLGYSEDARYFAFEEFGVQDGPGFPYANLYILDLQADQWVKGTPVRVRLEDESGSVSDARTQAMDQAQATLDSLGIGAAAEIIALNGDGATGIDDQSLRFGRPGYGMAAPEPAYELSLSKVSAAMPHCADMATEGVSGFALTLRLAGTSKEVYRDTTVPESRGCPEGYRLYAVVTPFDDLAAFAPELGPGAVAIVSVYSAGFEGPDRRFIAVPLAF